LSALHAMFLLGLTGERCGSPQSRRVDAAWSSMPVALAFSGFHQSCVMPPGRLVLSE